MFCPKCGAHNADTSKFCNSCGRSFHDLTPAPAPTLDTASPPYAGAAPSVIGTTIDKYIILKKLGEGGMGAVFLARHSSLDQPRAVKILPGALAENKTYIARFFKEAKSAASIDHPNIVRVYDAGEAQGYYYFAMEYVDGESFGKVLERRGALPWKESLQVVKQVLDAFRAAHALGIVHRDIKPENIMLSRTGIVKVADFGLAKNIAETTGLTRTGQIMGTPSYMSPEQCKGEPADGRSDIYSLGATLYTILAGRPIFSAETPLALLQKHVAEEPRPLGEIRRDVPAPIAAIIHKMLAKDPAMRYQSADEALAAIAAVEKQLELAPGDTRPLAAMAASAGPSPFNAPTTPTPASVTPAPQATPASGARIEDKAGQKPGKHAGVWEFAVIAIIGLVVILIVLLVKGPPEQPPGSTAAAGPTAQAPAPPGTATVSQTGTAAIQTPAPAVTEIPSGHVSNYVSENAFAVVELRDIDKWDAQLEKNPMLNAGPLQKYIATIREQMGEDRAEMYKEMGVSQRTVQDVLSSIRGVSVAVEQYNPGRSISELSLDFIAGIACDADKLYSLLTTFSFVKRQVKISGADAVEIDFEEFKFYAAAKNGKMYAGTFDLLTDALADKKRANSLADSADFKDAWKQIGRGNFACYIRGLQFAELFVSMTFAQPMLQAFSKAVEFDTIRYATAVEDGSELTFRIAGVSAKFWELFDFPADKPKLLEMIPDNSAYAYRISFGKWEKPLDRAIDWLSVKAATPDGRASNIEDLCRGLEEIKTNFGPYPVRELGIFANSWNGIPLFVYRLDNSDSAMEFLSKYLHFEDGVEDYNSDRYVRRVKWDYVGIGELVKLERTYERKEFAMDNNGEYTGNWVKAETFTQFAGHKDSYIVVHDGYDTNGNYEQAIRRVLQSMSDGKNLYAYVMEPYLKRKPGEPEKPLAEKNALEMASACTALYAVNAAQLGPQLEEGMGLGPDATSALKDFRLLIVAAKEPTAITIKVNAPAITPVLTVLKNIIK
jgi:serine/threonine protein kinase